MGLVTTRGVWVREVCMSHEWEGKKGIVMWVGGNGKGSACVTSMGGNVENGDSVLDGCSGRASILFGTSRGAVTSPATKRNIIVRMWRSRWHSISGAGDCDVGGWKWEGKCVRDINWW